MIWCYPVSIHTPARGVTINAFTMPAESGGFNPHSRTGSDLAKDTSVACKSVSIHTPARGVTNLNTYIERQENVSIHTPARGVTDTINNARPGHAVSIHTPARGVTNYA